MGWRSAFAYDRPADIWREHARLTAYRNDGDRLLNLRSHATIGHDAYGAMQPFRWAGTPVADRRLPTPAGTARLVLTRRMEVPARRDGRRAGQKCDRQSSTGVS